MFNSKRIIKWAFGLGIAVLAGQSAHAGLADWHLTPNLPGQAKYDQTFTALWVPYGNPASTVNPNDAAAATTGAVNGITYTIWDNYGPHGNATTGTNHNVQDFGGQSFDAKAMFVRNDATTLYVGVVTGFDPAGVTVDGVSYKMGDLAINPNFAASTSQFGAITLTGGPSSGTTSLVAGGTWNVPNGNMGWNGPAKTNYVAGGSTVATDVHYSFTDLNVSYRDDVTGKYVGQYLVEYAIPLAEMGLSQGGNVSLSWGLSCGNDVIGACHNVAVPEPASISLIGGLGVLLLGRRRRTARAAA